MKCCVAYDAFVKYISVSYNLTEDNAVELPDEDLKSNNDTLVNFRSYLKTKKVFEAVA